MNPLLLNIMLAILWTVATGDLTLLNVVFGFIVAYAALRLTAPLYGGSGYFRRVGLIVSLAGLFLKELVLSSIRVIQDVLTPEHQSTPGFIAMPLEAQTDVEVFLTANIISLTPGTLSVDVSDDRNTLFVHAMFLEDVDEVIADMKRLEDRVLEVLR